MATIYDLPKLLRVEGYELRAKGPGAGEPFDSNVYKIEYDSAGVTLCLCGEDARNLFLGHDTTTVCFLKNHVLFCAGGERVCVLELIRVEDTGPNILELLA